MTHANCTMDPGEKIGILGIPFDDKSSFRKGSSQGPEYILRTLRSEAQNPYSEDGTKTSDWVTNIPIGTIYDYWDIEALVFDHLAKHPKLLSLGGDHSITFPILRAYQRKFKKIDILHFDAHSDLYDVFMGDPYSHACPFARIMEEKLTTRLVQVGVRTQTTHLREQVKKFGVEVIEMKDFNRHDIGSFEHPLYISIDLDGFDPSFAPGVAHQEAGGLLPRDVIHIIQNLDVPIIGADIVEYNPSLDVSNITAGLAAKLVKELISKMMSG